jgi:hypothetical protein
MRRREFIKLLSNTVLAWPLTARAQQSAKLPTIGFLATGTATTYGPWIAAFTGHLHELGWDAGRAVAIEYRFAEGHSERYAEIATEFVRLKVDVIVTMGAAALAAKHATSSIPIVFAAAEDPLGGGLVASLAHPGENLTGSSLEASDLASKRLEYLRGCSQPASIGCDRQCRLPGRGAGNARSRSRRQQARNRGYDCHMLTFLAIACKQKFVLDSYEDEAVGHLEKNADGKLAITRVELRPKIRVGWISPSPSALNPSKLAWSEENDRGHVLGRNICESGTNKISSASGSGDRRCEMSPEEFAKSYPPLLDWIQTTLTATAQVAQTVASRGFSRLPLYFAERILASTKVVLVDSLPMPPLSSMGLARFAEFERGNFDGITYVDTIFLKPALSNNEIIHFHELVHVIQWRLLGPDRFLLSYANGLECFGYRQSPLEAIAYDAETVFASTTTPFNVEKMVAEKFGL